MRPCKEAIKMKMRIAGSEIIEESTRNVRTTNALSKYKIFHAVFEYTRYETFSTSNWMLDSRMRTRM